MASFFNPKKFFKDLYSEKPRLAIVISMVAASCIGFSGIFVRLSEVGPLSTGLFRFFFAIPFLWTWMMFDNAKTQKPTMPATPKEYLMLLAAAAFFALDICIWNISLTMTTVVNSTLLNNMTTIFVAFFAWFILKEKPTLYMVMGVLLAIMGSFILVGQSFTFALQSFYGDMLALLSAVFYAGYIVISKNLRNSFTSATIMAWTSLFTFYFIALFLFIAPEPIFPQTVAGWFVLIGFAIVVHVIGQGLMNYSIRHLTAAFASIVMMMGPVMAASAAWILFGEKLTLMQLIGACVILIGIIIARQSAHEKAEDLKETVNQT